jgi:hypothetical protein
MKPQGRENEVNGFAVNVLLGSEEEANQLMGRMRSIKQLKDILLANREIDPKTKCWVWTGHWDKSGYGVVWVCPKERRRSSVHKVALYVFSGKALEERFLVRHSCKTSACFNPDHMVLFATRKEFLQWLAKKKMHARGEKVARATITLLQALEIRFALQDDYETCSQIARRLNCSYRQVWGIKKKETWKEIWGMTEKDLERMKNENDN